MDYETITLDEKDGVATVLLNRPDKMNALTTQMRAEITHAVKDAGKRARVVLIMGAGRAFCSGQDLEGLVPGRLKGHQLGKGTNDLVLDLG